MEFGIVVSGLGVAAVLLLPLALKWQIKMRHALVGVLLFGGVAGALLSGSSAGRDMTTPAVLLLQAGVVVACTFVAVPLLFYRDPEREPPDRAGAVVSPADGTVVYVKKLEDAREVLSEKHGRDIQIRQPLGSSHAMQPIYLVGIGMNLLNVHVNRAPIGGQVTSLRHKRGRFASLKHEDATLLNESLTTVIENGRLSVAVIQIASRLVRRIVTYLREGQDVSTGQRIGMIKFGSQVDVAIPAGRGIRILVQPGDEVVAGVSVVAEHGQGEHLGQGGDVS